MKLLCVLAVLIAFASASQAACPPGLTTANATIATNDVILITSPLLSYNDSLTACQCFGDGWKLGNSTAIFDYRPSRSNQSSAAYDTIKALMLASLTAPAKAWFGYQYVDYKLNDCPSFEVNPSSSYQSLSPCTDKYAAVCTRSKLVYNPVGSACDNNLQLCAPGGYCDASTGTCAVDTICYPTNPCQAGLATGYSSNKADTICTVTPGAPGGYKCECGQIQAVTTGPGPQTCVECPSANPCALIRCPAGSGCAYACGDSRGLRCETPDGVVVPSVTSPPATSAPSPVASGSPSTVSSGTPAPTIGRNACPPGLTTANATIATNDVILITSPLLSYNDSLTACQCFGDGWKLGNSTAIFDYRPSRSNQSSAAYDTIKALMLATLTAPAKAWFGYQYVDYKLNDCPSFEVNPSSSDQSLSPCTDKYAAVCTRSKLVYNPVGSDCDNNLQLCAPGGYCDASTGTCAVDTICYPTNPCQAGLATGYSSNKADTICTVTPGAPGGYKCECGQIQAVTTGPGPQTCVECPSANPCALIRCPAGSGCAYACGDPRGLRCETPDGVMVPSVTSPPYTSAPSPVASGNPSSVSSGTPAPTSGGNACQANPCGAGGVCSPTPSSGSPYTCVCSSGFIANGGTCTPRPVEPYHSGF